MSLRPVAGDVITIKNLEKLACVYRDGIYETAFDGEYIFTDQGTFPLRDVTSIVPFANIPRGDQ